jgi:hypothetical protein
MTKWESSTNESREDLNGGSIKVTYPIEDISGQAPRRWKTVKALVDSRVEASIINS